MNEKDTTLIDKTFYPGWLMVSQLRSGLDVQNGDALYRRACQWVNEAREALMAADFSETASDTMLYAYCALMDESVLNRGKQDDGYRKWRKDPLQAHFFSTLNAGEELWERTRTVLREPAPNIAVLTCLYRTLQLGFVGQYRAQDDERREDVVKMLGERVFAITQSFSQTPPVEEQLRQLQTQPVSPALSDATSSHLRQLLSRYVLLENR